MLADVRALGEMEMNLITNVPHKLIIIAQLISQKAMYLFFSL